MRGQEGPTGRAKNLYDEFRVFKYGNRYKLYFREIQVKINLLVTAKLQDPLINDLNV